MASDTSKIGKVKVVRDLCIGAASCVAIAPDAFELDDQNIAVVKELKTTDQETLMLAAKSCPTKAIIVESEEGKQLFP
ncbi:MAG: ferredoxin [Candidatus Buchananbacteria bacterium CG10_big_fil_rev_8_21_14_0_10_42_9]|uniref:Ferredoxin n=1 Tax=Candidatus Buchananbacteria bacterium CG10_big_fil_rev_8_21_14_0_10_42_9 TaxID=1974526 RepID=A0A2H0W2K3_9BACT|nr:MAG: ferredoxin [Candidatus Buchananbacteria bacterium CG10_big_fil_rev_8_21_14_0_10_42_9]